MFVLSCPMEWDSAWKQVSDVSLDTPQRRGHALRQCMLRYITSLGLPKDGATIASLSPEDVRAIEEGNTNCHPMHMQGLFPRVYECPPSYWLSLPRVLFLQVDSK